MEDRSGYIYILKAHNPAEGCYKIGRTVKPRQRLHDFGVRLPFRFDVVAMYKLDDCHQGERHAHEFFAGKRLDGEWFRLDDLDLALFDAAMLLHEAARLYAGFVHNIKCQDDADYVAKLRWLLPAVKARRDRRRAAHRVIYEQWKG